MSLDLETILVSSILSEKAQAQFAAGDIAHSELKPFVECLEQLSSSYVSGKARKIDSRLMAQAYALYYLPINFAKILQLLSHLSPNYFTANSRALDFGCGPGTATLALQSAGFLGEIRGVDSSAYMLEMAKDLTGQAASGSKIIFGQAHEGLFDLIILGNVLNELGEAKAKTVMQELLTSLSPTGAIVILEPALKAETQATMRLRDFVLESDPSISPIFPCTHRNPCPMLAQDSENWCHGTLNWEEPRLTRQLDKLTGFNKHRIKYTGFVFQRGVAPVNGLRLLDEPRKTKRGFECLLCGEGVYGIQLLDKAVAKRLRQFDII